MGRDERLKSWTIELGQPKHDFWNDKLVPTEVPDSFLRAVTPVVDFARWMDSEMAKIREITPFKNLEIKKISMEESVVDLGEAEHFKGTLKINARTRVCEVKFVPTLDCHIAKAKALWGWSGPSYEIAEHINKRLNLAKLTMKGKIEEAKGIWEIQKRFMKPYEDLETEDRFTYPEGMDTIVSGEPTEHTKELLRSLIDEK